jgi:hypothetical protein
MNDALIACVKAAGGSKRVGPLLWPEKDGGAAQRQLLDCLNEDRPQQLNPEQVVLVLRLARQAGYHQGMEYLAEALSYTRPAPVEPEDERALLQREFNEGARRLEKLVERMERIGPQAPAVRAVA